MKKFKLLFSIIIITICGYTFYKVINNNLIDKKIDYQIQSATSKLQDNDNINSSSSNETLTTSKDNTNNNISNDDFSVLVQSPKYNAIVSLDENSKEFKVSLLEEVSKANIDSTSHYINLTQDNIDYLIQNKDTLIDKFKSCGILDKYNMITDMIKSYDTNINSSDLIELGLKYITK